MKAQAINDVDRQRFFTNFNEPLLKQIRIIKQYTKTKENEPTKSGIHGAALHGAKRNINRKRV